MYRPKFIRSGTVISRNTVLLLLALVITLISLAGSGYALLFEVTQPVPNRFSLASPPTPQIREDFTGSVKSNVQIVNTAEYPCYIRSAVVVNLLDEKGSVLPQAPAAGTDYAVSFGSGWFQGGDGYWYYPSPLAAGSATTNLIDSCTALSDIGQLEVTILSQCIQARPARAVEEAWGVTVDSSGNLH